MRTRTGTVVCLGNEQRITIAMTPKEKRDRKNMLHRKNEKRRSKIKSIKLFGIGGTVERRLLTAARVRKRFDD